MKMTKKIVTDTTGIFVNYDISNSNINFAENIVASKLGSVSKNVAYFPSVSFFLWYLKYILSEFMPLEPLCKIS